MIGGALLLAALLTLGLVALLELPDIAMAAIAVLGNPEAADTWIEDCSIVMANMHLEAAASGVGSCWVQGRMRTAADGRGRPFEMSHVVAPGDHTRFSVHLKRDGVSWGPAE